MSYSEIVWNNLSDMLLDMAAVLFVMTVVMIWAVRNNRRAVPPPPTSPPAPPLEGEGSALDTVGVGSLKSSEPPVPDKLPSPVAGDPAWK